MLRGFSLTLSPRPDNIEGHPFFAANNVNGIAITSILDYQVLPLDPDVQALQEAYIRKVVDAVHDLPNVLYEVANESPGGGAIDQQMAGMLSRPELDGLRARTPRRGVPGAGAGRDRPVHRHGRARHVRSRVVQRGGARDHRRRRGDRRARGRCRVRPADRGSAVLYLRASGSDA